MNQPVDDLTITMPWCGAIAANLALAGPAAARPALESGMVSLLPDVLRGPASSAQPAPLSTLNGDRSG